MSLADAISQLSPTFTGQLLQPNDTGYDDARRVHNGLIDKRPALIARCQGTADVVDAVKLARTLGLEVAVRGGGHNVAGRATIDNGLMIDLAPMKGIFLDPRQRTVRAQGGVLWKELNRETQAHGLATTGGVVGTTGIAGLTLGGGLGWLMPKYGLALDNLRAAELVMADGSVRRVSATEDPDLFWAIRGGGGNFGVATWLEFELYPVGPTIVGGLVAHPFSAARDVLRFYRDFTASLPDDLTVFAGLLHAPDGSGAKLAAIIAVHAGALDAGATAVAPLKRFGSPVMDVIGPMPYSAANMMFDAGFPKGALNYWKSNFLATLKDEAIDTLIERFAAAPSPMNGLLLEHFHGAATRVSPTETAFPHRSVGYNFLAVGEWVDSAQTAPNVAWTREAYAAMRPHFAEGRYVNYLNAEEMNEGGAVESAFGPNWRRLREVKRCYDPDNVFHLNQNIKP